MESLAIIVPVYNEESVLQEFYQRTSAVLNDLDGMSSTILFIDDGSSDNSVDIIRDLIRKDDRLSLIRLSRNFGKEAALTAGLDHVDADAVIIIDADLQDPPELIPRMIQLWREGYDTVYGQRTERYGESFVKKTTASLFYRFMAGVGRVAIPRDTGDFRLISRRAVNALRSLSESNRFMKGLFSWIGYPQVALRYSRDPRHAGDSKFNYWKLWNFALDGITSFTTLPLKMASYLGMLLAFGSFIYGAYVIIKTIVWGDPVPGYPSLMTVVLFIGGIQLMFLGVLGEYLGRMFDETKRRPLYLIQEHINNGAEK
ncbi:glycosyltransferase family 2 protein [Marinobacter panjinensis]|uniref:Glycosyltransferase family 2 protein n=1 Tax=Marinobacter panjinensis TaxID=2576384 RepID=A0A4U6R337_9GAMM|nr:glycosyltransferase family 2 protein [Marinobacter panjinensis]MCR8915805.1 glycosyltransferase family 2 protein [Marinobacter panjinensis]TKV67218.1 glycosyltransferase family 2 protein [Marinobacter panjinensis]